MAASIIIYHSLLQYVTIADHHHGINLPHRI